MRNLELKKTMEHGGSPSSGSGEERHKKGDLIKEREQPQALEQPCQFQ